MRGELRDGFQQARVLRSGALGEAVIDRKRDAWKGVQMRQ